MSKRQFVAPGLARLSVLLAALWAANGLADEKQLLQAIEAQSGAIKQVSQQIFEFKELGQQEFKSSQLVVDELRKLGFKVETDLKVPDDLVKGGVAKTAFRAELPGKGPGPTVTIMLEYDALPNGHSCGHNLISGSGLLAAAGLSKVMKDLPGRLLVIGTPDEERGSLGGGKIALLECLADEVIKDPAGVKDRLDTCLLCGACQANCPSGVKTMDIFLKARAFLTGYYGLPPVKRAIFRGLL
ncbi:MAG: hypothetical protein QMB52_08890 [Propionivibrio sp.]